MNYPFKFDFNRSLQAAAFLLRRERNRNMNYMRLTKLLYIADRESLRDTGRPITGAKPVAIVRGLVLQEVLELVRGQHYDTPRWSNFIRREKYQLELIDDPGIGRLSKYMTAILEEIAARHEEHDEWDMVAITHELPEWRYNDPGKSSRRIPFNEILAAIGRSADADLIVANATLDAAATKFFCDELRTTVEV